MQSISLKIVINSIISRCENSEDLFIGAVLPDPRKVLRGSGNQRYERKVMVDDAKEELVFIRPGCQNPNRATCFWEIIKTYVLCWFHIKMLLVHRNFVTLLTYYATLSRL